MTSEVVKRVPSSIIDYTIKDQPDDENEIKFGPETTRLARLAETSR